MNRKLIISAMAFAITTSLNAQKLDKQTYTHPSPYTVEKISAPKGKKVKNVILMIGDGMSLNHIQCAWTCNRGQLWLENAQYTGLSKTPIADRLIADSGSGGTALATGHRTVYHAVGVDEWGNTQPSLIDLAHAKGLSTGVAVTCRLWDATPCDFMAHNIDRDKEEDLIGQFPNSPVDYVFGGGAKMFRASGREDKRDIFAELKDKGYTIVPTYEEFLNYQGGKAYCVPFDGDTPVPAERKDMLAKASLHQMQMLSKDKDGFFMMIEGSQLDDYGHWNDINLLMQETLDFDQTVGEVLKWAAKDGETLVVVTADHETGGVTLIGGDLESGTIEARFTTTDHSGVMVPIYAFGPGAENFSGIMKNTEVQQKIKKLLKL